MNLVLIRMENNITYKPNKYIFSRPESGSSNSRLGRVGLRSGEKSLLEQKWHISVYTVPAQN